MDADRLSNNVLNVGGILFACKMCVHRYTRIYFMVVTYKGILFQDKYVALAPLQTHID